MLADECIGCGGATLGIKHIGCPPCHDRCGAKGARASVPPSLCGVSTRGVSAPAVMSPSSAERAARVRRERKEKGNGNKVDMWIHVIK